MKFRKKRKAVAVAIVPLILSQDRVEHSSWFVEMREAISSNRHA